MTSAVSSQVAIGQADSQAKRPHLARGLAVVAALVHDHATVAGQKLGAGERES